VGQGVDDGKRPALGDRPFLLSGRSSAARPADLRASDPKIRTEIVTAAQAPKPGEPIVVDVYVQNLEQADLRKNKFSPISSSVGTPTFSIVKVPQGDEMAFSPDSSAPCLTTGTTGTSRQPAATRIALDPSSCRQALAFTFFTATFAGWCKRGRVLQEELARGNLLEKPEEAATKKHYENVVRFARQFAAGGVFDVTAWAYSRSNTVRIRVE
jgi:hypothetical protein